MAQEKPDSSSNSPDPPAAEGESPPSSPAEASGGDPTTVEQLSELKKKADERDAYRNELLRAKADLDNFQKRMRRERPAWEEQAVRRFLRDLLPVADNLERALSHAPPTSGGELRQGVLITRQMLAQVLSDHGVVEIPAESVPFNPEVHEAVSEVEVTDKPTGMIVEVLEKGYKHRDAVLRPSRVNVARNVKDAASPAASKDSEES